MRSATWAARRGSAWPCLSTAGIASSRSRPTWSECNSDRSPRSRAGPAPSRSIPVEEIVRVLAEPQPSHPRGAPRRDHRIAAELRHGTGSLSVPRREPSHHLDPEALAGLEDLSVEEILAILDTAESFAEISTRSRKKVPALQGRIVFNLFFENSTRTRTSFSLAAKRLSADTQDFSAERLEPFQGGDVHRHGQEHRGHGGRRHGRSTSHAGRPASAGSAREGVDHQRRRRRPRAPHPGAARPLDDPQAPRGESRA